MAFPFCFVWIVTTLNLYFTLIAVLPLKSLDAMKGDKDAVKQEILHINSDASHEFSSIWAGSRFSLEYYLFIYLFLMYNRTKSVWAGTLYLREQRTCFWRHSVFMVDLLVSRSPQFASQHCSAHQPWASCFAFLFFCWSFKQERDATQFLANTHGQIFSLLSQLLL